MYEFEIRGKYPGSPWETIDTTDNEDEAKFLRREYIMAFGTGWRITYRKVKRSEP